MCTAMVWLVLSLCRWFSKAKNIQSDSNFRFGNEMHLCLLCQVFLRNILIDTNYFFLSLAYSKGILSLSLSVSFFVFYSTYQRNRWRKCPQAVMCRVHLEGISFFFAFVLSCSRLSFFSSLLYPLAFSMSDNDGGLNIGWIVVLAAVLVHETWWQVEAMDNSNWWIEFIHLKKYTNKHPEMFKMRITCFRGSKLFKRDQSFWIAKKMNFERNVSYSLLFSWDSHIETLVMPFSLSASDFLIHSHVYYYYKRKNVFIIKNRMTKKGGTIK
jgi:hypothetical protein